MSEKPMEGWEVQGLTYVLPGTRGIDERPERPMVLMRISRPVLMHPNNDRRRKKVPVLVRVTNEAIEREAWDSLSAAYRNAGAVVTERPKRLHE